MIVASDDAFSYALRTAYLHYLLQPRPRRQVAPPAQQLAAINRISTSSFQDLVADFSRTHRDPKSIRFPKGFLPLLRDRITAVVMGHDLSAEYKDPSLKPTFGSFYVAFIEPRFYDNAAKSRRPEDLLLIFYTHATRELKKLKPDDSWKPLVDRHVALFVRLMGAVIKEQGWSSSNPELTLRLATLEKKLLRHDENLAEDGSSRGSTPATILGPPEPLSYNVNDMPMVKTVARVFCVPLETCQQDINSKMGIWTEKAAFQDLKAYMSNISLNTTRTLRKEDFDLNEAYEAWCKSEKAELADLILVMGRSHQELISSSISPAPSTRAKLGHMSSLSSYDIHGSNQMHRTSMYESPSTMHGGGLSVDSLTFPNGNGAEGDDDAPYVYVPPDPRVFYRHIVNRCLTADYTDQDVELEPIDIPGADEPARLLSKGSLELLNQCALRWRVPKFSRMVLFMDAFRSKYQEQSVDISMLDNAFMYFDKEVDTNWVSWTVSDQNMYRVTLSSVHDYILRELCDLLQHAYDKKQVPIGAVMWVLDQHIYNNELFIKGSLDEFVEQTKDILKENAADVLQAMFDEEISQQGDQLDPLHVVNLAQKVIKLTERISKRFKSPVLEYAPSPNRKLF